MNCQVCWESECSVQQLEQMSKLSVMIHLSFVCTTIKTNFPFSFIFTATCQLSNLFCSGLWDSLNKYNKKSSTEIWQKKFAFRGQLSWLFHTFADLVNELGTQHWINWLVHITVFHDNHIFGTLTSFPWPKWKTQHWIQCFFEIV